MTTTISSNLVRSPFDFGSYSESVTTATVGTGSPQTYDIDLSSSQVFDLTLGGDVTFTFSNPASSGKATSFVIIVTQAGSPANYSITWPTSVDWAGGNEPFVSQAVSSVDIYHFFTVDNGTTWYGTVGGQGFA